MTQTRDGRCKLGLGPGRMRYKLAHTGIQCRIKGLPLEVVVAGTSRGPALIHAMRMRTQYVKLLEGGRQWT